MITIENGSYIVNFRYDRVMVQQLKTLIPSTKRKWDPMRKVWIIAGDQVHALKQIFTMTNIPPMPTHKPTTEQRILDVRYIGRTKDRGDAERSAFGYCNGDWSVVFPESVLKNFLEGGFDDIETPSGSFYSVLGVAQNATEREIKSGYRRMAKQWHPDVCREPNAADVFMSVQRAYDVLSNGDKKARYDAGLMLAGNQPKQSGNAFDDLQSDGYAPRYRCGLIMATGRDILGRFVVDKIDMWEDITNERGETLVTSWAFGDDKFTEIFI